MVSEPPSLLSAHRCGTERNLSGTGWRLGLTGFPLGAQALMDSAEQTLEAVPRAGTPPEVSELFLASCPVGAEADTERVPRCHCSYLVTAGCCEGVES